MSAALGDVHGLPMS